MSAYLKAIISVLFLIVYVITANADSDNTKEKLQAKKMNNASIKEEKSILAVVNGEKITIKDYNEKYRQLSDYEKAMYRNEEGHKNFLDKLIRDKLLLQRAKRLGLDKDEEVKKRINEIMVDVTESVITESLVKREVLDKVVVTDKEAKEYYDKHRDEFKESEKIKLAQIVAKTDDEVNKIHQELKNNADFGELAKEKSIDEGTAAKGGDIGYIELERLPTELQKACANLKIGEFTEPVKTRLGYHILKIEDKKGASTKEFYEVSTQIKSRLISEKQQQEYNKWLNQLEKSGKIEIKANFDENK